MPINTTDELKKAVKVRAETYGLPKITCHGDGTFNARIAIVSEAPGSREEALGRPMVGESGNIMWKTLRKHGISRQEVYVTNVCKRMIKKSKAKPVNLVASDGVTLATITTEMELKPAEEGQWIDIVNWELSQLPNLKYIFIMGNLALKAIVDKKGITHWRGSKIDVEMDTRDGTKRTIQTMCTFNPVMILRQPQTEITYNLDCHKFMRVMEGKHKEYVIEPIINPSCNEALSFIEKMHDEKLPTALDIETSSMETACIGLANDPHTGMCISFRDIKSDTYTRQEEIQIRRRFQKFFSDEDTRLVAQHGMFDATWLWHKDAIDVKKIHFDTMLAHHVLYPQLPHNLGFLTTQYTDHPYYKDERENWREGGDIDGYWRYNVKDCCLLLPIREGLLRELEQAKLDKFFYSHVMRLQPHLIKMCVGGIRVDTDLKEKVASALVEEVAKQKQAFYDAVQIATEQEGYEPNPNSPRQLSDLLFNKLHLIGRGRSTDEENRKRMIKHKRTTDASRTVLSTLGTYKKDSKFLSTYANAVIDEDGRMRCIYNQTGVQSAPGRLSSSKVLWGSGMNLQNQPERALQVYIADDEYVFIYFDLAQAEARFVAWDYKIASWMTQYEKARIDGSYDCHRALASEMFGIAYDDVPTGDREDSGEPTIRYTAKRCKHGLNYRMQPDRLATTLGIPLAEAQRLWHIYHHTTPELRIGWAATEKEVRKTKCLYNSYGRRFILLERISQESLKSIVAFRPQSSIGDHVTRTIYMSESDPNWPSHARIALNVHDALIALVRKDQANTALSIMKKHAEYPLYIHGEEMIIPADCKISYPDEMGIHRWSNLQTVSIEAAA